VCGSTRPSPLQPSDFLPTAQLDEALVWHMSADHLNTASITPVDLSISLLYFCCFSFLIYIRSLGILSVDLRLPSPPIFACFF